MTLLPVSPAAAHRDYPQIGKAFLERERRRLGPLFAQEHEGEFLASAGSIFAASDLDAVFQAPVVPGLDEMIEEGGRYGEADRLRRGLVR